MKGQIAYSVTDYVCKDYPMHFEWYWAKEIPRVFNGTGEVVICTINNNVAGVAFLIFNIKIHKFTYSYSR